MPDFSNRRLRRGVFHSLVDLQAAINRYLAEHNQSPRPFVWTADPDAIIAAASSRVPSVRCDPLVSEDYPWPLSKNPRVHSAVVRAYLVAAGVPAAEVSGTHVTTTMVGGGPVSDGVQPSRPTPLWYTTHLERSLGGIPVEGSYAFAALDSAGHVITEGVYWPAISASVVHKARALKQRLASANEKDTFLADVQAKRPDVGNAVGTVKIVHTSSGYHGEFEANAVYSVVARSTSGGKAEIVRFDETGGSRADGRRAAERDETSRKR